VDSFKFYHAQQNYFGKNQSIFRPIQLLDGILTRSTKITLEKTEVFSRSNWLLDRIIMTISTEFTSEITKVFLRSIQALSINSCHVMK
jgi:hypothetical protein